MFLRSSRFIFYSILSVLLSFSGWIVHNSAQDSTWINRQLYPLEALLASGNTECYGNQQKFLKQALKASRWQGSLASQVAYLSPEGQLTVCASAPRGESPNTSARYRYASLTKLFTAQATITLMAEQGLSLSTPLTEFVPQAKNAEDERWKKITIAQLLTHSAGFDRHLSHDPMTRHGVTPWCPNNLDRIKATHLDFEPGEAYGYSNLTYCLLGVVVEKLANKPYTEAMESLFRLKKFGLSFVDGPYLDDEIGYDFRHAGFYTDNYYQYLDFFALASSAGLSGSAEGLLRLLQTLKQAKELHVTKPIWPGDCDISKLRQCYGYAVFPYQPKEGDLTVFVQQGYVFGSSSSLVLDEYGGIFLWLGNGSAPKGKGSASDNMLNVMYGLLEKHYAKTPAAAGVIR